jgi:hypothetical protein
LTKVLRCVHPAATTRIPNWCCLLKIVGYTRSRHSHHLMYIDQSLCPPVHSDNQLIPASHSTFSVSKASVYTMSSLLIIVTLKKSRLCLPVPSSNRFAICWLLARQLYNYGRTVASSALDSPARWHFRNWSNVAGNLVRKRNVIEPTSCGLAVLLQRGNDHALVR